MTKREKSLTDTGTKMTPEQSAAVDVLRELYYSPQKIEAHIIEQVTPGCIITGFRGFLKKQLTKDMLPKGENWSWNQSNARVTYKLNEETTVAMYKLNPRKLMAEGAKQPSYKLWIYLISNTRDKESPRFLHSFMWCEKGDEQPVTLMDLDFLMDFMTPEESTNIFGVINYHIM